MDVKAYLWEAAHGKYTRALPILSFPAVQRMNVTVKELVGNAQLQAQAMELIVRETNSLAAISLMDLSVEAEAFGAQVRFFENEVPAVTGQLVSDENEAATLAVPGMDAARLPVCIEAVRLAKEKICDRPVLAGMIGPYSLAGRLMDVTEIMYACYDEPETVHMVLDKAAEFLITYGKALREAGADGIMMAEPLAGVLSPDMMAEFSAPYVKRIIDALQGDDFAVIYHNCGNSAARMLEHIFAQGAAAYHFGNAVDMAQVLAGAPADALCMGNVDPAAQFVQGTPESMGEAVCALMDACAAYPNFLLSSGCDIPAHAKWENIHAFFGALKKSNEKAE